MKIVSLAFVAAGILTGFTMATAQTKSAPSLGAQKFTEVEGISEYRLGNGLRVLLFPDSTKPTVTVNITYFVGSRLEGRGETGMAHLLEHMLFKGTNDHKNIWKLLEDHGAQFNGTTWYDRTNYYETLPAGEDSLEFALKMEADRMVNSLILKSDLDTEFTVVRNEFEMGENDPVGILSERMISAAYLWHNYGKSTIGSRSDIERVPIENLQAFYRKYYRPDNAMLVVAGDFKAEAALKLVEKYFAGLKNPATPIDNTYTVEPTQDGPRHVELRRTGEVSAAGSVYHICPGPHPDFAAIEALRHVLVNEPSGRLYQALVASGMAASVSGSAYGLKEPGFIQFMASVRTEQPVEPVLAKMNEIVEGLGASNITEEELSRAKNRLLKDYDLSFRNAQRLAVELSEWASAGDWRLLFLYRDAVEKLTVADLKRVAANYLKPSNRTSGLFSPSKEIDRAAIPDTVDVTSAVNGYKGKAALSEGASFDPTPENIEARVKRTEIREGLKIALLAKKTRGDSVRALLTLHVGTEFDFVGKTAAASAIPGMCMRGTTKRSYQQIRDEMDKLKARISLGAGTRPGSVNASIETDRANLVASIELVAEMLKSPALAAEEFEIEKREKLAQLEEQVTDPQALSFNNLLRRMNPWPASDVRYIPTVPESVEQIKALKIEDLRAMHAALYGANRAEMTVVGSFDEAAVLAAAEKAFAGWKSAKPFARIESKLRDDFKPGEETILTPDKQMATVAAGLVFALRNDEPDFPALNFANYVLGASAKSRLLDRLRQKEGLSYGAFSFLQASDLDRMATWGAGAICAPQNAEKAMTSLLDELHKLAKDGISEEEMDDAKESWALQTERNLAEDGFVARELNNGLFTGRTMLYQKDLIEKTAKLTPETVKEAIAKVLKTEKLVRVKAGDLKAAGN